MLTCEPERGSLEPRSIRRQSTMVDASSIHTMMEVPMPQSLGSLKDLLITHNEEYRRLDQQHHEYESRLTTLTEKIVLSEEEQIEEVTLKKKKLQVKDRMEVIARQAREGAVHP